MGEKSVYILKHVQNEDAGTIADFLSARRIPFRYVELYAGEALPALSEVRSVVVMGGPMNVDEEDKFPFLKAENAFIQNVGKKNIPYLGVCLGSQLLAKAFGARIYKASVPEVGWGEVTLTRDALKDPLFAGLKEETLPVLQWHEDTFDIPKGAQLIATNPVVPNQALSVNGRMYGFQFHVEVKRPMLEDWFGKREDKVAILAKLASLEPKLKALTDTIFGNFFGMA